MAVTPLLVFGVSLAGGCKEKTAGAGAEPIATGTVRGKPQKLTWAAYDKRMEEYVECLHKNGMPGVRYKGHDENAKVDEELAGIPADVGEKVYPAFQKCGTIQPTWMERPVPFAHDKASPEDMAIARAMARCIRANGVPDYPDPVPDFHALSTAEKNAIDKFNPKDNPDVKVAMGKCRKDLGLPEPDERG